MANEAAGVTYPSNSNIAYSSGTPRMSTRFKSVLLTPSSWGLKNSRLTHGPPTRGFAGLFRGEFRMIRLVNMIFLIVKQQSVSGLPAPQVQPRDGMRFDYSEDVQPDRPGTPPRKVGRGRQERSTEVTTPDSHSSSPGIFTKPLAVGAPGSPG